MEVVESDGESRDRGIEGSRDRIGESRREGGEDGRHPVDPVGVGGGRGEDPVDPAGAGGRRVEAVVEEWVVQDEWWRSPIHRRYVEVVLEGGGHVVLFEDLNTGEWFMQRP